MSSGGFSALFDAALDRRRGVLSDAGTTVCRLFAGAADGMAGVYVERWGNAATLATYEGVAEAGLDAGYLAGCVLDGLRAADVWGETEGAVYWKPFVRSRGEAGGEVESVLREQRPLAGDPVDEEVEILEGGVSYGARLWDGFSCGLFVDQRANRGWLGRWCAQLGREVRDSVRVLNLFAYTGGFGVAAAVQGMWNGVQVETSNVDVSGKYLDWAKRNYERNGLVVGEESGHHFVRADARQFVAMATKKGWRWDAIVIDPPTFGSADSRRGVPVWRVEKDLATLVGDACGVLSPGGVILVSTNAGSMSEEDRLARAVLKGVGEVGRRLEWIELPAVGADVLGGDPDASDGAMGRFSAVAFGV